MTVKTLTAEEFDRMFDDGEDISEYVDWSSARRAEDALGQIHLELPNWLILTLKNEAQKLGVTHEVLVRRWLEERLAQADEPK